MQPLFVLDAPQYHHIDGARVYRVRGAALSLDDRPVENIIVGETRANVSLPCPELAMIDRPNAAHARFEFDLFIDPARTYEFRANDETLFVFDARDHERARAAADAIAKFPVPPPELVRTTQGGDDVTSYRDSAVSGFFSMERLLREAGHDPSSIHDVLDVGCGTGRMLLGWHAANPRRRLAGADINRDLIAWNEASLPNVAEWRVSNVQPPLPFGEASFDLIQLTSVFTHLPLDYQRAWIAELRRLLRRDGSILITLHGDTYAELLLDPQSRASFAESGYVEVAGADPGANAFATFHSRAFAERLLGESADVRWFARGNLTPPALFPIAALQDAYVIRPPLSS